MFVTSSRILRADGSRNEQLVAEVEVWRASMRSGRAPGCLPDRRCQAAEASLSAEFTFCFCPVPSLLVQGCARDGRLTPAKSTNVPWRGVAKHCAARRRQCCTTCKPAPRHEEAAIGRRPSRLTTVVAVETAIRHR